MRFTTDDVGKIIVRMFKMSPNILQNIRIDDTDPSNLVISHDGPEVFMVRIFGVGLEKPERKKKKK